MKKCAILASTVLLIVSLTACSLSASKSTEKERKQKRKKETEEEVTEIEKTTETEEPTTAGPAEPGPVKSEMIRCLNNGTETLWEISYFDADTGDLLRHESYNSDGMLRSYEEYVFQDGHVIEEETCLCFNHTDGTKTTHTKTLTYVYDVEGFLIEKSGQVIQEDEGADPVVEMVITILFEYDEKGLLVLEKNTSENKINNTGGTVDIVYTYDNDGNLIVKQRGRSAKYQYYYDGENLVREEEFGTLQDSNGPILLSAFDYEYDDQGRLIRDIEYAFDEEGETILYRIQDYTYDDKNLCIRIDVTDGDLTYWYDFVYYYE